MYPPFEGLPSLVLSESAQRYNCGTKTVTIIDVNLLHEHYPYILATLTHFICNTRYNYIKLCVVLRGDGALNRGMATLLCMNNVLC